MENASKALLIAGAILLCILLIAIGMFIYNSAQSTITESLTNMSTQEIEAFNNNFLTYEGAQTGSNIKSLLGRLVGNAKTYEDEPVNVPYVCIESSLGATAVTVPADAAGNQQTYIRALGVERNNVETKHEYWVEFTFQDNGIIDYICISYDPAAKMNPLYR